MCASVFFEILRTLELFAADSTKEWLHREVDTQMTCDVIAFRVGSLAAVPMARETQVVFAVASHMIITEMLVQLFSVIRLYIAATPQALCLAIRC